MLTTTTRKTPTFVERLGDYVVLWHFFQTKSVSGPWSKLASADGGPVRHLEGVYRQVEEEEAERTVTVFDADGEAQPLFLRSCGSQGLRLD